MKLTEEEPTPIGQFALACEQMNEFARTMCRSRRFATVTTGQDIRYYRGGEWSRGGWRLEKWVEAELDKDEGLWAAWWLELGPHERGWLVESDVTICPDIFSAGLDDRMATSPQELGKQLNAAVDDLINALDRNKQFAEEVRKRMRKGHAGR